MDEKENRPDDGRKLEKIRMNESVDSNCPDCDHSPVLIYERVLIEGSLENYHLIHTEVEDFYECPGCKHSWRKFQYL